MFKELEQSIGIDQKKQSVKLTQAPTLGKREHGKFLVPVQYSVVQADLIYMKPDKKGYNYILTVVDVASRKIDAIPLKGREAEDVIEGFEQVFKRKYLPENKILNIYTDPGSEFKNKKVHEYFKEKEINLRHTMTARKNQMAIVEYYNYVITKHLGKKITSAELETKQDYDTWSDDLEKMVKVMNQSKYEKTISLKELFGDPVISKNEDMLQVGTVVHVKLQQPIDHTVTDKKQRLTGGFRHGDLRFEPTTTTISNVMIYPNQPVRYMVEKYKNVSFLRKELLVADAQGTKQQKEKDKAVKDKADEQQKEDHSLVHVGRLTRSKSKKIDAQKGNSKYPNMVVE